jgi:hypothetical protein
MTNHSTAISYDIYCMMLWITWPGNHFSVCPVPLVPCVMATNRDCRFRTIYYPSRRSPPCAGSLCKAHGFRVTNIADSASLFEARGRRPRLNPRLLRPAIIVLFDQADFRIVQLKEPVRDLIGDRIRERRTKAGNTVKRGNPAARRQNTGMNRRRLPMLQHFRLLPNSF